MKLFVRVMLIKKRLMQRNRQKMVIKKRGVVEVAVKYYKVVGRRGQKAIKAESVCDGKLEKVKKPTVKVGRGLSFKKGQEVRKLRVRKREEKEAVGG